MKRRGLLHVSAAMLALSPVPGVSTTAKAGEPAITLQTDCSTYKPGVFGASAQCRKEKLRLSQEALKSSQAREACLDKLIAFKGQNPTGWANLLASQGKDAIKENPCGVVPLLPK